MSSRKTFLLFCSELDMSWTTSQRFRSYSMEQSPSWEASWFLAGQEIPRILWNPKVLYLIHNCPPPFPILSHINPVHALTSHFLKIYSSGLFHHVSLPKPCIHLYSSPFMLHAPHISFFLIWSLKLLGEKYRSLNSSLCSVPHSPVLIPFRPKYYQHPILTHPQSVFLPQCERPSFTSIQHNTQNYISVYLNLSVFEGPCHHGKACPQVADGGTVSNMEGSCE